MRLRILEVNRVMLDPCGGLFLTYFLLIIRRICLKDSSEYGFDQVG